MTPIFAADNKKRQAGLTLLELLIALALTGLLAAAAASGMRTDAARLDVKIASEQLLADLKQARRTAEADSAPVRLVFTPDRYIISKLDLDRPLPRGVEVAIEPDAASDADSREIIFGPGLQLTSYRIALSKGRHQTSIVIDPLTHRIAPQ